MSYNLDLSVLSVQEYREILKHQTLLPGRKMLLNDIDHHFEAIARQGIDNIAQLKKRLASKTKSSDFSAAAGIPEDYVTILKREIGSLTQKPVPIADFLGIDGSTVSRLYERGINNSKDYYESKPSGRDELFCLCDLVRINGVGAVAAKTFYEAGYRSVADVAGADAAVMLKKVSYVNEEKQYYRAKLGEKDMQFCIDFAKLLIRYGD